MEADDQLVDVCVVCALAEEAQAFLHLVENYCQISWSTKVNERDDYRLAIISNVERESLQLHISWPPRYGPQEMVLHLTHVLQDVQPRLVVMTGICAGDQRHVHLGDLIVAERTFTADSGKIATDTQGQTVHQHDTITYLLSEPLLHFVQLFDHWKALVAPLVRPRSKRHQRDWLLQRLLQEATTSVTAVSLDELTDQAPDWRRIVHELQQGTEPLLLPSLALRDKTLIERLQYGLDPFPFLDPPEARCHLKPLASSNAVRGDNPFKNIQVPVRGAIAVDMEGAALGRVMRGFPTLPWLIVKGVTDYADQDKDDSYHEYAATASAAYALSFIQEYVTQERLPRRLSASRDGPSVWTVPLQHHPFFTGQEALLAKLAETLRTDRSAALTGLGGIGKTQIAVEYAWRYRQTYQYVFWSRADTHEALVAGYVVLAGHLNLPEKEVKDQTVIVQAVLRWLSTHTGWLLILDNVEDLVLLQDFLPGVRQGHLLLTTRSQATGTLAHALKVDTMLPNVGSRHFYPPKSPLVY